MTLSIRVIYFSIVSMSFFSVNWIFWQKGAYFSFEGIYFGLIYVLTVAFLLVRIGRARLFLNKPLIVHMALVLVSSLTILYSPDKFIGLRDVMSFVWLWLMHLLAKDVLYNSRNDYLRTLYSVLICFLALHILFVAFGFASGRLAFSFEQESEVSDVRWLFMLPSDILGVIVFLSLAYYLFSEKRLTSAFVCILASTLLFLNFSKTHLAATLISILLFLAVSRSSRIGVASVLAVMFAGAIALLITDNPFTRQLFFSPVEARNALMNSPKMAFELLNASGRFQIWEFLLQESSRSDGGLLFGAGVGAARHILFNNPYGVIGLAAHSDYVRLMAEFGLIGVSAYLGLSLFLLFRFRKECVQANGVSRRIAAAVLFMLTAYIMIAGIGYEVLNLYRYGMLVWVLMLALLYSRPYTAKTGGYSLNSTPASCL